MAYSKSWLRRPRFPICEACSTPTLCGRRRSDHHQQLLSNNNEIEHLRVVIAKLRRMLFGTKTERVEREIEQLE